MSDGCVTGICCLDNWTSNCSKNCQDSYWLNIRCRTGPFGAPWIGRSQSRGHSVQAAKMMYYPFVHPPRAVLWQALLYWDELTSITPEDGYEIGPELEVLRDRGLYRPTHADDLPWAAHAALVGELRQVVEEVSGKDLVPVPGPLEAHNRLYWGKLPEEVQNELLAIGALAPQGHMLHVSPVLLSRLMVVLAKHLAAATQGMIPFTESASACHVAFKPLGQTNLPTRYCWQMQIGELLPVPADDTPLEKVLQFREACTSEREELARAVRKLLLELSVPNPDSGSDPEQTREAVEIAVQRIKKAVQKLEKARHSGGIVWLKRGLLVLGGLGAASAAAFVPPMAAGALTAVSALGIGVAPIVTRTGVTTDFTYLQQLQSIFPGTSWPSARPTS